MPIECNQNATQRRPAHGRVPPGPSPGQDAAGGRGPGLQRGGAHHRQHAVRAQRILQVGRRGLDASGVVGVLLALTSLGVGFLL